MTQTSFQGGSIRNFFSLLRALSVWVCAIATLGGALGGVSALAQDDLASRRADAKTQMARAEAERATLETKSEEQRTLADYKQLVNAYRRVYLITPNAMEVPQAIEEVGDLYRTMGRLFDHTYYDTAVETYEFLRHEYPMSHLSEDALLGIADVQRNGLAQSNLAQQSYQDFLKNYPHSQHADDARRALAEMQAEEKLSAMEAPPAPAADDADGGAAGDSASEVGAIRVWNADSYTRIIIDLNGQAKYQAARIDDPDRIYFDIDSAKLNHQLLQAPIDVPSGGYLKSIRVAQNRSNVVRVVLEVTKVKDYSVFELANPDRLVVDVYGPNATNTTSARTPGTLGLGSALGAPTARSKSASAGGTPNALSGAPAGPTVAPPASKTVAAKSPATGTPAATRTPEMASVKDVKAPVASPSGPAAKGPAPLSAKSEAAATGPAAVPERTHNGERSLTRALGLKIGRIVIDAGHGGHDTGTIGSTGLMEKDLCLDVALRLGKMIEERLPGADVVYTREDDSFVGLEQRTKIANDAKADLFLSIHANSSDDKRANGIETYYLNFNSSPEAMEVAARENALAQGSVHELQDLVKKIASNEKTEESRDLATDIQDSLAKRTDHSEPNRGVRTAPFVVLIGANMPSVLAEISFLSNPDDEQWLKKPENRQRIAEGLYQGIESYLHSTNSLTLNAAAPESAGRSTAVAPSTDPQ